MRGVRMAEVSMRSVCRMIIMPEMAGLCRVESQQSNGSLRANVQGLSYWLGLCVLSKSVAVR